MQLEEEKVWEIEALKEAQAEWQHKVAEEITMLRKAQDDLIIENAQLCASCGKVEKVVDEACQHIFENIANITAVAKAK